MRTGRRSLLIAGLAISPSPALNKGDLIAIDVLIQPGPKMLAEATRWNARMREQIPEGFELDEEHVPHITLIQCFVARADLPKVLAVGGVRSKFDIDRMEMTAIGLFHVVSGNSGLAGIVVEPSAQLVGTERAE